ncbi:MAG: aminopeptidase P family protein, partial [Actinobacteria bacterium]|nr:aminopeptidase P family protein [Actinomycetota bacterium]
EELKIKQEAVNYVIANYYYHSKPGITLGELFEVGKKAYSTAGYPGEWENHIQGGIAGYKPLEFLVLPGSKVTVDNNNILGWNPTIKGAKAEDPTLVQNGEAIQFSIDKRWPYSEVEVEGKKFLRPDILEKS